MQTSDDQLPKWLDVGVAACKRGVGWVGGKRRGGESDSIMSGASSKEEERTQKSLLLTP